MSVYNNIQIYTQFIHVDFEDITSIKGYQSYKTRLAVDRPFELASEENAFSFVLPLSELGHVKDNSLLFIDENMLEIHVVLHIAHQVFCNKFPEKNYVDHLITASHLLIHID